MNCVNTLDIVANSPLFRGAAEPELQRFIAQCEIQTLAKREALFLQGSPVERFYLVLKGQIKVYRLDPKGQRQVVLCLEGVGGVVAAVAAFLKKPHYPASAEATLPSEVLVISTQAFASLLERNPMLRSKMLQFTAEHARAIVQVLDRIVFQQVDSRLAEYLLSEVNGQVFKLPTNPEIAAIIGTTAEPVSRKLGHFSQQGWVEIKQRKLKILNRQALQQLSQSE